MIPTQRYGTAFRKIVISEWEVSLLRVSESMAIVMAEQHVEDSVPEHSAFIMMSYYILCSAAAAST
jgi:hypothetical protein